MTKHDDRKRRVRARMAKTGESYTTARARLAASTGAGLAGSRSSRSARGQNELSTIDLVVGLPTSRELVAAVQQARLSASAAGDITPIHLLAALAHTAPSIAHDALVEAGVDLARLRALAVTSTDDDVAVADTDVKMSVSSRSAFEHARAAHPGWVARRYGVEPDDRRDSWRPMRTGHLLLGLLDQGSILAIVPELATPALRESVLRLLQGDLELPRRGL